MIIPLLFGLGYLIAGLTLIVLTERSPQYRRDITPKNRFEEGKSPFWQVNVLNPRNYPPESMRFYWSLIGTVVLQLICLIGLVWSVANHF